MPSALTVLAKTEEKNIFLITLRKTGKIEKIIYKKRGIPF